MTNDQSTKQDKVAVAVVTTSGAYPGDGYVSESVKQKVEVILKQAAHKLGIIDTARWVAKVGSRTIDPLKTYEENSLFGQVDIDWGPSEGGGGRR